MVKGGSEYLSHRRISDTPTSKALSAAIGLTEIRGEATPSEEIRSHAGKKPCVFSRLIVEKFSHQTKGWVRVYMSERRAPFKISDASGSVRVDPAEAAIHATMSIAVREVYLLRGGQPARTQGELSSELSRQAHQFSLPGQNHIIGDPMEVASEPAIASILSSLPQKEGMKTPGSKSAIEVARLLHAAQPLPDGLRSSAPGAFRFTEEWIPSGAIVYALGTAESDGGELMIRRGRDGILLISDSSEKQLSEGRAKSSLMVALAGLILLSLSFALAVLLFL